MVLKTARRVLSLLVLLGLCHCGDDDNPVVSDVSMRGSLTDFVSTVENAEEVFTDRLHVAILGSILGKKVTLYGNVYHKNRGVWEYSLRDTVNFVSV